MAENNIYIKERRKAYYLKGFFYLAMMVLSLWVAFQPFYSDEHTYTSPGRFYLIGGIIFAVFAALFVYLLIREWVPRNAFTLNARGFIDMHNVGSETVIDWTNVESVKILGGSDSRFLGVSLVNVDIVADKMKKKQARAMRENIEEGLPAILISEGEIRVSIDSLKNTFSKFVREARTLDSDTSSKKQKVNPFSTDDVLRAFGQLPKEDGDDASGNDSSANTANTIVKTDTESDEADAFTDALLRTESDETDSDRSEDSTADVLADESDNDGADNTAVSTDVTNGKTSDDAMDGEIQELLSRSKSSRISELEKILSGEDALPPTDDVKSEDDIATDVAADTVDDIISDASAVDAEDVTADDVSASDATDTQPSEDDHSPVIAADDISNHPHSTDDTDESLDPAFKLSLKALSESFQDDDDQPDVVIKSDSDDGEIVLREPSSDETSVYPDLVLISEIDEDAKKSDTSSTPDEDDQISFIISIDEDD